MKGFHTDILRRFDRLKFISKATIVQAITHVQSHEQYQQLAVNNMYQLRNIKRK